MVCNFISELTKSLTVGTSEDASPPLKLLHGVRVSANALLADEGQDTLLSTRILSHSQQFELIHLTATVLAFADAVAPLLESQQLAERAQAGEPHVVAEAESAKAAAAENLNDKLAQLETAEIPFLIGALPSRYVQPFIDAALHCISLGLKNIDRRSRFEYELFANTRSRFDEMSKIWLAKRTRSAQWVLSYLNIMDGASRRADLGVVSSVQPVLQNWLQPTSEFAAKRKEAWQRYRNFLISLPDAKETMFAEDFGVRKVFVEPQAAYRIAGPTAGNVSETGQVASLIASLISDRVSSEDLILLCGGPGSGKSTLCRVLASELAKNESIHPVFLRLRRLQDGQDIPSFLETQLQKEGVIDKISELANISNLVLILDGFDELVMANRSRLREFFNNLREDLASGPLRNAKAIVSGRDTLFPKGAGLPIGSHVISLLPFDADRVTVWGEKWRALHQGEGARFHPEKLLDQTQANKRAHSSPLHHLISWPLTLHLVARVHQSGALQIDERGPQTVEKASLYRSIVAQTALRQHGQSDGKGRLSTEQMRQFVQLVSWEMYSTARDALDYTEGLPILKIVFPDPTDAELIELSEVAIVNQPELTKGEEGGFEFVHKSFSEYFAAERMAHSLARVSFKSEDYDSNTPTWRMTEREALFELATILAIRPLTLEVQEMVEPMLGDFRLFQDPTRSPTQSASKNLHVAALRDKLLRFQALIELYATGNLHGDVYERVRGKKGVRNELDAHAALSVGLLSIGCALASRINRLNAKPDKSAFIELEYATFHKLLCFIQAGEVVIDDQLARRCFSGVSLKSSEEKNKGDATLVWYPPVAPVLLRNVRGLNMPLAAAAHSITQANTILAIENIVLSALNTAGQSPPGRLLGIGSRSVRLHDDDVEALNRSGVLPYGGQRGRNMEELDRFERSIHELGLYLRHVGPISPAIFAELEVRLSDVIHSAERGRRHLNSQQAERLRGIISGLISSLQLGGSAPPKHERGPG